MHGSCRIRALYLFFRAREWRERVSMRGAEAKRKKANINVHPKNRHHGRVNAATP